MTRKTPPKPSKNFSRKPAKGRAKPAIRKTVEDVVKPKSRPEAPLTARLVALRLLRRILDKGQSFDQAQEQIGGDLFQLEERDRGFARAICLNVLRHKGQLDELIAAYLDHPVTGDQGLVADFLRVGMVQLLVLDTPPHAAVGELLSLLDKKTEFSVARKYKGLINAILGRVDREGRAVFATQNAAKLNTPSWLWESWVASFGEEVAEQIAAANLEAAPIDMTPRGDVDVSTVLDLIPLPEGRIRLPAGYQVQQVPGFDDGKWWVQDIASSLPLVLAEKAMGSFAGKTVIDLCAAPGGKTMQLAAAGAKVIAVDISKKRLKRLEENLERLNLSAEVHAADVAKWDTPELADFVFLDAPCSATGTMRRHPDLAHIKQPEDVVKLAGTQTRLLYKAWEMVKPGGYFMYAVCSLERAEAEDQFDAFLKECDDATAVAFSKDMLPELDICISEAGQLRCRPDMLSEIGGMDGFFAGLIQKKANG